MTTPMLSNELAAALGQVTTDAIVEAFPSKYKNKKKYFIKQNVSIHEYNMHVLVYHLRLIRVPHPIYYDRAWKCMVMEKIHGANVSNIFGDCAYNVPMHIRKEIQRMIRILTAHQIQYVDITGYNFVIDSHNEDRIWLVDFEHTYESEYVPPCVETFCVTSVEDMEWNAEFK
jgi:tRNA A-37 threonylcarbamoyl transferase component Bud32